jgi:general stress protein YciG
MTEEAKTPQKKPRGFAAMDPEKQREIARKGGRIAHLRGHAHEFTPEEAREAGRKGGQAVSRDRTHMAKIGKLGGEARGQSRTGGQLEQPPSV